MAIHAAGIGGIFFCGYIQVRGKASDHFATSGGEWSRLSAEIAAAAEILTDMAPRGNPDPVEETWGRIAWALLRRLGTSSTVEQIVTDAVTPTVAPVSLINLVNGEHQ